MVRRLDRGYRCETYPREHQGYHRTLSLKKEGLDLRSSVVEIRIINETLRQYKDQIPI